VPDRREPGLRADAEALPQRARPAHRERAVLGTGHPPPRAAADHRRARRVPDHREEGPPLTEFVLGHHPSTSSVGTATTSVGVQHPRLRAPRRAGAPAAPIHQTFEGDGFVICSFCPRPYDFDPEAVPAPTRTERDVGRGAVLREPGVHEPQGIEYGSITLHPDGLPHGPHPGRTEASIGQKQTDELAVMLDTFRPLRVSTTALPSRTATTSDRGRVDTGVGRPSAPLHAWSAGWLTTPGCSPGVAVAARRGRALRGLPSWPSAWILGGSSFRPDAWASCRRRLRAPARQREGPPVAHLGPRGPR